MRERMKIISKQHEKCQKCVYAKECDHKRMVACGLMELPVKMSASASEGVTVNASADVLEKHDFRRVKIGGIYITVDMEDMKKDLERAFYKSIGCPWA